MFQGWDSYYLLVGGASGALIGLLFVVASLTTSLERESALRGASLYLTPVVFHFAAVVVVSGVALAPAAHAAAAGGLIGATAVTGLANATRVSLGVGRGKALQAPHWSDLWCYGVGPALIYAGLAAAAAGVAEGSALAVDGVAATVMALLLLSIRNAWDLVTWLAPRAPDGRADS